MKILSRSPRAQIITECLVEPGDDLTDGSFMPPLAAGFQREDVRISMDDRGRTLMTTTDAETTPLRLDFAEMKGET